ncbi:uncharacterized protein MYCFIDRAFT_153016 [Pseudocercospora fijiensis CIRAD86]|uniref:HTH TFE/IIEalpha-type domain-containing protein n=1 Tax=Pseudocercospora fijiensis (strain CIRAD86) TaxID=383855 RepID=M3B669_PSEFD|nr:uncharacterized protein MYCFIDRAFT_153016 [Pseudocercospora fijiensis CIRAD86]EME84828.1 hypothetical protein MYCFIDRAFT_153016 [Pseudocercospora fijiensis CIRAD86]
MADLAQSLIRTVARGFYHTDHILVIDALTRHSTLQDSDLALVLGTQVKPLRKTCGRLKEDGLISVQSRAERRTDGSSSFYGGAPQQGKERLTNRDWYYINYHRAIDCIKYRMHKLSKHIESQGAPTTEKKDLKCLTPNCGGSYTELEVMDLQDFMTGEFPCPRCKHILQPVEPEERANENENMKRLNVELEKLLSLMQKIDAANVPENDFETALANQKPIHRSDANPGARTEIVDQPNRNLQSVKGLALQPEKIAVQMQDDEDVKRENAAAEARARKEKEAKQNALPEWISKSTIDGSTTAVGAKEEKQRAERDANSAVFKDEDTEEKKVVGADKDIMDQYWEELKKQQAEEAQQNKEEDEEDEDDDEDEFEDVDVSGGGNTPANGAANGTAATSGMNTPMNADSSNATDDERDTKRVKFEPSSLSNGRPAEDTPAASDADDDEMEFEDVGA